MKKIISFVLCLSIALTCLAGIASADVISQNFTTTFTHTQTSVTTADCRAAAKANYYAAISVTAKGTFIRGTGLSDAGQSYSTTKTSKTNSDRPGIRTGEINATTGVKNPRDYYKSGSAYGKYTWRYMYD